MEARSVGSSQWRGRRGGRWAARLGGVMALLAGAGLAGDQQVAVAGEVRQSDALEPPDAVEDQAPGRSVLLLAEARAEPAASATGFAAGAGGAGPTNRYAEQPELRLGPGESAFGIVHSEDGAATFAGAPLFPASHLGHTEYLTINLTRDPLGRTALVVQRDFEDGGLRGAVVDLEREAVLVPALIPEDRVRALNPGTTRILVDSSAWSADGRFLIVPYRPEGDPEKVQIVDLASGAVVGGSTAHTGWYFPDLEAVVWGDDRVTLPFGEPYCEIVCGRFEATFALPGAEPLPPMADDPRPAVAEALLGDLRAVQERLRYYGRWIETTGIFDSQTREALTRAQDIYCLPSTGEVDWDTAWALAGGIEPFSCVRHPVPPDREDPPLPRQDLAATGSDQATTVSRPVNEASLLSNASGNVFDCRLEDMPWRECWIREGATPAIMHLGSLIEVEVEDFEVPRGPGVLYDFLAFGDVDVAYVDFPYALQAGSPIEYFPMANGVQAFVWPRPLIQREVETGRFEDPLLQGIKDRHGGLTSFMEPVFIGYRDLPDGRQRFVYSHSLNRLTPLPRDAVASAYGHFDFLGGRLVSVEIRGAIEIERRPSAGSIGEIQRGLTRRGYEPGPVDGQMGPVTRNAVREFQAEHCLEVTGEVNAQTRQMITAEAGYFLHGRARPVVQPCGPGLGVGEVAVLDSDADGGTPVTEPDVVSVEKLQRIDRGLRASKNMAEMLEYLMMLHEFAKDIRDWQHATVLLDSILTPQAVAQAQLQAAEMNLGLTAGGLAARAMIKDAYLRAAKDPANALWFTAMSEPITLAVVDSAFAIVGGAVTQDPTAAYALGVATLGRIIDATIEYRALSRDMNALVSDVLRATAETLGHRAEGRLTDETALGMFAVTDQISADLLGAVPLATWANKREAAHKLWIIAKLAEIKVKEGPIRISLLMTGEVRDEIRRLDGLMQPGPTALRGPVFQHFADEVAILFGIRRWDPMVAR